MGIYTIFRRELTSYFLTPLAYIFIVIFLAMAGTFTFFVGNFFGRGQADLQPFFQFHPWLYLFLIPAITMRLWAEERKTGSIELLLTLPISMTDAVLGKFLAGWAFLAIAVLLSFPMALTVGYLGAPDWGVIVTTYVGAILMAGGYLGVCALASAMTKNQVISFVISLGACAVLLFLGFSSFTETLEGVLPLAAADALANFSFITHFDAFTKGIIDPKDVLFFLSLMGFTLFLNVVVLER